ncbi:MAG: enoyl-CoA hydratase/isomerase family protein [Betaproteobacteria bacterium]|nr:enoyl-CoA hydratase/isomerase family protein [Betaproteobacteria bacterium]
MPIDLIVDGPVAKVVINRPEKLNALSWDMREALIKHFNELRYDNSIRAIIVTGGGKVFCSGADVERMDKQDLLAARERTQRGGHAMIRALHAIEKPVIAAVRGVAVGIGWSIALACDIIIASETARFSQIYRKVGLVPDGGACWFLMRLLGMARAKELFFSARFVHAPEALTLGLVNHVVRDDELMAKAEALARDYADGPTFTFGMGKKLMHMAAGPSLEDFLEFECMVQPQMNQTVDHHEGVAAFKEKRKPKFHGR